MGARVAIAALLVALAAPAAALAQDCPRTSLADIEDEVMCVACEVPLELATDAPQAQRERDFINELIAQCKSKEEVKAALTAEFGDEVLATPGDEGFDLAAYLVPALAVLAGGAALGVAVRGWRRGGGGARSEAEERGQPSAAVAERLDSDLDRYEL